MNIEQHSLNMLLSVLFNQSLFNFTSAEFFLLFFSFFNLILNLIIFSTRTLEAKKSF